MSKRTSGFRGGWQGFRVAREPTGLALRWENRSAGAMYDEQASDGARPHVRHHSVKERGRQTATATALAKIWWGTLGYAGVVNGH
jgi:hypothetical protein